MKVCIVIPAYNEQKRIAATLKAYNQFFSDKKTTENLDYEILVLINGTTDATPAIVADLQKEMPNLLSREIKEGGKGLAVNVGFSDALTRPNDLIGFVDADMATSPQAFYDLIAHLDNYDGIIASRYMPGASVTPPRPFIKRWGSKLFFGSLVRILFGLRYYDTQCGAKVFKRKVMETIVPYLSVKQWAFDIELLSLCKKFGFTIKEFPTIWNDQEGSKLQTVSAGFAMIKTLFVLRRHQREKGIR
jgi:glycosyltransferase involved in cell wall biosynthesis